MSIFFLEYATKNKTKSEISSLSSSLKISDIFKATFLVKFIAASENVTVEGVKAFAILTRPEVLFSFLLLYQLFTSRLKCLRAWHEYADSKRIQEDMKLLADKHRRLTLLKGRFLKWKKRVCCLFASREFLCQDDCKLNYVHYFSVHVQEEASGTDRTVAKESIW